MSNKPRIREEDARLAEGVDFVFELADERDIKSTEEEAKAAHEMADPDGCPDSYYQSLKDYFVEKEAEVEKCYQADFPCEEIARFDSQSEALAAGVKESNLWSVVEDYGNGGEKTVTFIYGPSHHYVNLLYVIQTKEVHDGKTYYEETHEMLD